VAANDGDGTNVDQRDATILLLRSEVTKLQEQLKSQSETPPHTQRDVQKCDALCAYSLPCLAGVTDVMAVAGLTDVKEVTEVTATNVDMAALEKKLKEEGLQPAAVTVENLSDMSAELNTLRPLRSLLTASQSELKRLQSELQLLQSQNQTLVGQLEQSKIALQAQQQQAAMAQQTVTMLQQQAIEAQQAAVAAAAATASASMSGSGGSGALGAVGMGGAQVMTMPIASRSVVVTQQLPAAALGATGGSYVTGGGSYGTSGGTGGASSMSSTMFTSPSSVMSPTTVIKMGNLPDGLRRQVDQVTRAASPTKERPGIQQYGGTMYASPMVNQSASVGGVTMFGGQSGMSSSAGGGVSLYSSNPGMTGLSPGYKYGGEPGGGTPQNYI
jgi:hypothetical protein